MVQNFETHLDYLGSESVNLLIICEKKGGMITLHLHTEHLQTLLWAEASTEKAIPTSFKANNIATAQGQRSRF